MAKQPQQNNGLTELKAAIRSKAPGRLYVFYGEETFLLNYYLEQLRGILLDELTESFNFHKLTNETFDIQSFGDCVENLPMMAEHTLVWVEDVDIFKLPESDREKMTAVLSDIPPYCTVVFTYLTVSWKPDKRQKKLWDAIEAAGCVVEFAKQSQRDLIAWVTRHFSAQGKQIAPELAAYLIDITGGTMTALVGEISKIAAFAAETAITKADVDAVTEPVMDAVVFQMTDLMSQGACGQALRKLQQLLKMQQDPIAILGAVGMHFRRLSTARILLDHGKGAADMMRLCNLGDYPARKMLSAAGRFPASFYERAAQLVLETDYRMKTSFDTQERLLELLVIQLAQEMRNG